MGCHINSTREVNFGNASRNSRFTGYWLQSISQSVRRGKLRCEEDQGAPQSACPAMLPRAPPNNLKSPVLESLRTNKKQDRNTALPIRLPKIILVSQPLLDMALPTKETRHNSTHQRAGTCSSHEEAYTSFRTNLTHQGTDTRSKSNYDSAACTKETTYTESKTKWDNREICCRCRNKIKPHKNN